MQEIRCSSPKCNKVVGRIESGKAEFKCKTCGTYTTVEILPTQMAPDNDITKATRFEGTATAYVGRLIRG
jgi:tRNA(Ile2) C34 agmatinyltransferase TiaS